MNRRSSSAGGIRMNLEYAYGSAGPVYLPLTSPGPGDGSR